MKKGTSVPAIKIKSREAARAVIKFNELEDEYQALLNLPSDESEWDERDQEVAYVRDIRMEAARRLNEVEKQISELPKTDPEAKKLKATRKEIVTEINELPAAGSTFSEWEELSDEERSPGIGRPPTPIEVSLLRASDQREQKLSELRQVEEDEGRSPASEEDILQYYKKATEKTGRSPIDPLGVLDRDIRNINVELEKIENGEAEAEYQEALNKATVSEQGKRYGRPPESPAKKKARLEKRLKALSDRRSAMEAALTPTEKMERHLKLKRDDVFYIRKGLRERGMDPREVDISGTTEASLLEKLEADIESIKGMIEKMKSGTDDSKYLAKYQNKVYEEGKKLIQKRNEEVRAEAKGNLQAGDFADLARDLGVG